MFICTKSISANLNDALLLQKYTIDVGYEKFLAPEIFFNPEIYSSDFLTPLPEIVDDVIQASPIDVRRGLYKVSLVSSCYIGRLAETPLEYCPLGRLYNVSTLWPASQA